MKKKLLTFLPVLILTLTSCGEKPYVYRGLEAYTKTSLKTSEDDFKILHLTDTHWGVGTIFAREEAFMTKLIGDTAPDMIVLGGDMFMHANPKIVDRFFEFIDSFDIPFCYTYGNHDFQGFYAGDYIDKKVQSCENSMLVNYDDGLSGKSNYYVNIEFATNPIPWQIIIMDSNSYVQGGNYDIFHPNQLEWYESIIKDTESKYGQLVNSLAFYHIPGLYYEQAWEDYVKDNPDYTCEPDGVGCDREGVAHGYKDDGLFDKMVELGSTKAIFVGHDHINNYHLDYHGIKLCYNLKCGENIYHDDDLLGGTIVTLNKDGVSYDIKRHYQTFEGIEG